jgi:GTP-binding protein
MVLADIPGLIEEAHQVLVLGTIFRHIQRTKVLVLIGWPSEDPVLDFAQLTASLPCLIRIGAETPDCCLNKIDLPEVREKWPVMSRRLKKSVKNNITDLFEISAVTGENVREVLYRAAERLAEVPAPVVEEETPVYRLEADPREFKIKRDGNSWQVKGAAIERAAAMTYWDSDDSIRRFQRS